MLQMFVSESRTQLPPYGRSWGAGRGRGSGKAGQRPQSRMTTLSTGHIANLFINSI
jgi:hypothetical protein